MALPSLQKTVAEAWKSIQDTSRRLNKTTQSLRDTSASGPSKIDDHVRLQRLLKRSVDSLDIEVLVPELEAYVRDQVDDQGLDLATEYAAVKAAAEVLRLWIFNNVPRDAEDDNAMLAGTVDAAGERTQLTLSSAETVDFRTAADTLLASMI